MSKKALEYLAAQNVTKVAMETLRAESNEVMKENAESLPPILEGLATLHEDEVTDARRQVQCRSVGIGDYPMDSHAVRPKTDWNSPDRT